MTCYLYFLGFPGPFTYSLPLIALMSLWPYSLGFLDLLTIFLPFSTFMDLLAIIPIILAY